MPIKSFILFFVAAMLATVAVHPASAQSSPSPVNPAYRVSAGDELFVSVFAEPELTVTLRVTESGLIGYPLLGDVNVKSLTTRDIEKKIISGLKGPYLVDPKVSVTVKAFRPFFVNGEVARQGPIPFQPGITIREAITLAGGFTERASKRKIFLLPEGLKNQTKGKKVTLDDPVGPGDVITVEQSFF